MNETPVIIEIIGIDDWLIFGRDAQGVVYFTVCEVWGVWLDSPNKGRADYGTSEDAADWRFVIKWADDNKADLSWQKVYSVGFETEGMTPGVMSASELSGIRRNMERVMNAPSVGWTRR